MVVQVGTLHRKMIRRNLAGQIVEWLDETDGGYIIRKGQVVNQERYNQEVAKQEDRKTAATAQSKAVNNPEAPVERAAKPGKMDEFDKRVGNLEDGMKEILKILKK